jgi:hypothetical protein
VDPVTVVIRAFEKMLSEQVSRAAARILREANRV